MEGQTGKRLDVEFGKKQGRRISPSSGLCSPGKRSARKSAQIFFGEENFGAFSNPTRSVLRAYFGKIVTKKKLRKKMNLLRKKINLGNFRKSSASESE